MPAVRGVNCPCERWGLLTHVGKYFLSFGFFSCAGCAWYQFSLRGVGIEDTYREVFSFILCILSIFQAGRDGKVMPWEGT